MALSSKTKQALKGKAHSLNPIVIIGNNGLTENVLMEIDRALTDHQLIKVRIQTEDRAERKALLQEICQQHQAELVQLVGKVGVLFRKNPI